MDSSIKAKIQHTLSSASLSFTNIIEGQDFEPLTPGSLPKYPSLLIANRGEIAIRLIRASHELGLRAISIYSYEDRLSMHRYKADEAYQIAAHDEMTPVGAYLAIDRIIDIAKSRNVSVIHPGYGFLSENAEFARKVQDAGIAFVGPTPEVIGNCGDKTKARELAIKAGVAVVPGSGAIENFAQAKMFIDQYGFPVIIKAAFGGGGRGMRVVREIESFQQLYERARSEALAAFGNGTVFLERFLEKPRHIEVQLLADNFGNVVHLFERDCSVQRRHQKVVEMGPALNMPDELRSQILNNAIKLAKEVGYRNAGTAEFLVDQQNRAYFIEINPRIQVEHTVTEEITGIDIVSAQIQIALGASLSSLGLCQDNITCRGYAIQCRVTTEDPTRNFQPDTGRIEVYRSPAGNGVRLDGGPGYSGAVISPHYDSLLVKCTCRGRDFESTRRKMICALLEFRVRGLKTNISFVTKLLRHPNFVKGNIWTTFIDDTPELIKGLHSGNRGQKLLRYLGELAINGGKVIGQNGVPILKSDPVIPVFEGYTKDLLNVPCQDGWRPVLLKEGPEAFCAAVRKHSGLLIMDTTWRDAHQSLLATRVRTIDIANIAKETSHVFKSLFALEAWGGATFDVSMRFLSECPWERLKTLRALVPNIPFQMLLRGANAVGYTSYPDNVIFEFCKHARLCGVDIFRVFDSLNYDENLILGVEAVKKAGGVAEAAISYTGDVSDLSRKLYNINYYLDLTDRLVAAGIHILAIKDMAGLLKPKAASILIGAIRKKYPNLVIHVHTHDTAGTGVASMIAAAEAGADIVDAAIDSMSGTTSQPSMGAIVAALQGSQLDTGLSQENIFSINSYWEQIRLLYSPFDPNVKSCDSTVYLHEMPGGQYTNLLFQSQQLGLGEQWQEIKKCYRIANKLCGDITKVTPSSKVVGDFAQFLVAQKLTEQDVIERADSLSFPQSVLEYFQGYLGIPPYGFPEPLRTKILGSRRLPRLDGRPGKSMEPFKFQDLETTLKDRWGVDHISEYDVLSAALYPEVFHDFKTSLDTYGDLTTLPTRIFLTPLQVGEEFTFVLEPGKTLIVKLMAIGQLHVESGTRDLYFSLNGEARVVSIIDTTTTDAPGNGKKALALRPKADPKRKGDVGAPMSGLVVEIRVSEGASVKIGDPLLVMSAMKMETIATATMAGVAINFVLPKRDFGMVIKVVPLGAGQDVGRSCILLSINNKNIMLDCGMHMGYQDHRRYPDFSYISNTNDFDGMLDAVIISHFHLDHCGSLPYFTEICGYNGPIYMTYPTASIAPLLLEDMRKVMVDRKNETNFFTSMDIKNCMRKVTSVDLHEVIQVDPEIQIKAYYAGHVLGAALFHIRVTDRLGASETCVYTGDYNMTPDRHLGSAWIDNCRPDLLITESTYATTIRDSKRARERDFLKNVHDTVARGGKVLIPVFALGRAQELLILIESYWERMKDLANVPLYFSAGLTERANDYYKLFISWTNEKVKKTYTDHNMFDFRMIKPWKQEYAEEPGPMVLFASPGMLHAGTSLTVFTKWCHDPLNTIIMPGYCVAGTVGAKVLAGQKDIDIDRFNKVTVNMQIKHLSFSAHADAKGIMALIQMAEAKNVMLVHGEKIKMALLKKRIESELGIPCFDPANGETITIQPKPSIPLSTSAFHIESILSNSRGKDENAVISEIPISGCIVLEQSRKKNNNQNMLYLASPEESLQKFNFNFTDIKPLTNEVMERCFKLEFNPYLIFPRLSFDHWKNFSSPHTPAFDSEETLKVGSVSISLTDECAYEIKCPDAFSKEANDILSLLNLIDLTKIV